MTHRNDRYEDKKESEKTGKGNPEKLHKKWADLSRAAEGEEKLLKGETDRVNDVRVIFYHNTMRKTLDRMEVVSFQQFKPDGFFIIITDAEEKRENLKEKVCAGAGAGALEGAEPPKKQYIVVYTHVRMRLGVRAKNVVNARSLPHM